MRIVEILLTKSPSDKSISPSVIKHIDELQQRMNKYVDKIMDPQTSQAGREFLKSRLRDDYLDIKHAIGSFHEIAESEIPEPAIKYEIYDRHTKERVAVGPYSTRSRARNAVDKLDNKYGAYRYGFRPVPLKEAVHKLPLSNKDFDLVKKMMENPIPATIAPIYISEFIVDDELSAQLAELEESSPALDVRPLIAEWFNRVMPDQMYRFRHDNPDEAQRKGVLSIIHGYDSHDYKGTNDPITGNAYGSFY